MAVGYRCLTYRQEATAGIIAKPASSLERYVRDVIGLKPIGRHKNIATGTRGVSCKRNRGRTRWQDMGKRRAHGEGALFVRNKGTARERWVGRLALADGTRQDVYGKTQAEAKKKLDQLKTQRADGLAPTSDKLRVGQFLTDWLQNTVRTSVRPGTFRGYSTIVNSYLVPKLGGVALVKLTPQDIQRFQNDLLRTPRKDGRGTVSSGTVANARRVLGRALQQATAWRMIARNPVRLVDGPHVTRKEITPLDPDQARELLAAVRGDRLEALYTVALALGLRRGEALGLKWSDVELENGLLHV